MRSKPNGAGFKKVAYAACFKVRDWFFEGAAASGFPMFGEYAEYTVCNISIYAQVLVFGHHHIGFHMLFLHKRLSLITNNCLHAST